MGAREFRGDDAGYLAWIAGNPRGYVINIRRGVAASDARLHQARCRTISGENPRGGLWTGGPYIKVCAVECMISIDGRVRTSESRSRAAGSADHRLVRSPTHRHPGKLALRAFSPGEKQQRA
jgi:hypothetical protein